MLAGIPGALPNSSNRDLSGLLQVKLAVTIWRAARMPVRATRRSNEGTPTVLWLHGGGWERGDKNGSSGARFLASAGFVTASIYYRLSGDAKFPADIDCKCAIRYLRANAGRYDLETRTESVLPALPQADIWPCWLAWLTRKLDWKAREGGRTSPVALLRSCPTMAQRI